jgi:hypothetical protein
VSGVWNGDPANRAGGAKQSFLCKVPEIGLVERFNN